MHLVWQFWEINRIYKKKIIMEQKAGSNSEGYFVKNQSGATSPPPPIQKKESDTLNGL